MTGCPRMPLTELENELRLQARERIERGELAVLRPTRLWGGFGCGELCSVCGEPVNSGETKYEIEATEGGQPVRSYFFHFICHAAWQLECARAEALKSP